MAFRNIWTSGGKPDHGFPFLKEFPECFGIGVYAGRILVMGESSIELEDLRRVSALVRSLVDSADFVSMDRDELLPALKEVETLKRLLAVLDAE